MRRSFCRSYLAFHLKFLNFLQTFVGVSIIIYSAWMLDQWNKQSLIPPPVAPPPESLGPILSMNLQNSEIIRVQLEHNLPLNRESAIVSGMDDDLQFYFHNLPAPWFIYSIMGVGVLLCAITCIGHIAAEWMNGCCLCFYSLLNTVLILLEVAMVAFIVFDNHWKEDLPNDSTGQLESLQSFIEDNIGICKWIGVTVLAIQVLALVLVMILRALVSTRIPDCDSDDDYAVIRARTRQPLLNSQLCPNSVSSSMESRGHSDIWSSRMREKYGLHAGDVNYTLMDPNPSPNMNTSTEDQSRCSIL